MKQVYKQILFMIIAVFPQIVTAQYNLPQNNVWAMGNYVGLDFNGTGNPAAITTSLNEAFSGGSASVSDEQGQLLFYSNGKQVWTATGALMPHGGALTGGNSNTANAIQGNLIVPFIGAEGGGENGRKKYYLFTIDNGFVGKLYCNLIDMSLNNGLGDVDTGFSLRGVLLADSLSGKMIAIPGCDNNIWVLVHEARKAIFQAFEVSDSGISQSPVFSDLTVQVPASTNYAFTHGAMCASPDRSRILSCNYQTASYGIAVFDFDYGSGTVFNPQALDTTTAYFGGAFSPDGSKIYARGWAWVGTGDFATYQFDLNAPDPVLSKTCVDTFYSMMSAIRLGPDGKIYFGSGNDYGYGYFHLGRINYPDSAGLNCGVEDSVPGTVFSVVFQDTLLLGQSFPNEVVLPGLGLNPLTIVFSADTLHAFPENYSSYQWYDNGVPVPGATSASFIVSANGWYSVKAGNGNCTDSAAYEVTGADTGTAIYDAGLPGNIHVYPNPATDHIYVQAPLKLNLSLYNREGKKCLQSYGTNTLNTAGLIRGLYFLTIRDPRGNLIGKEKIVVARP